MISTHLIVVGQNRSKRRRRRRRSLVVLTRRVAGLVARGRRRRRDDAVLLRVAPLLQLLDRLLRDQQLVGQILDALAHQVLLLLLHHDRPLERLLEPKLLELELVVGVLSFAEVKPQRPDLLDRAVKVIQKNEKLFNHVLPLHRLDGLQGGDFDGEEIRHGADLGQGGASGRRIGAGHRHSFVHLGVLHLLLVGELQLLLLVPQALLELLLHGDDQPTNFVLE